MCASSHPSRCAAAVTMRLPFRRKDKKKSESSSSSSYPDEFRSWPPAATFHAPPTYNSAQILSHLPHTVLQRIFAFVCPHTRDESYEPCEESANDDGCMLCDLRDLSHCAKVNRSWRASAVTVLYHSIRIDPVHYCKLEAFLAEKRKKTSRFDRNGIPEDPALARLRLFRRTVRDDPTRIGKLVQFLKTPYMIRESCHVELAQTIAVLPNLKYIDLPEGMFADEPNYATLRLEVQARCPNLRKMSYVRGSERSFAALGQPQVWPCLEVLELDRVDVDPLVLRNVLGSLTRLRALKVTETSSFSDEVMAVDDGLPPMPALEELVVKDAPRMTVAGLVAYLSWLETQSALRVLTLKDTGVQPWRLQEILQMAPALRTLAIQAKVQEPFPSNEGPPMLSSKRLKTLRYEISSTSGAGPYATPGYYSYLASCIMSGNLPRLRRLYVRDETFPDKLSGLPPPHAAFAGRRPGSSSSNASPPAVRVSALPVQPPRSPTFPSRQPMSPTGNPNRFSSNNPFAQPKAGPFPPTQTLEVFTKNDEYGKWNFARVDSFTTASPGGHGDRRPMSSYGLAADVTGPGWDRGEARMSVLIGNGTSGFLAVPGGAADSPGFALSAPPKPFANAARPRSSGGEAMRSRGQHWK
ncbi:F-box domain-containingprotein [Purpureocillium lavendulum]|uniref:F-box domain-containingprotein n=1 Tax=Purpureocillium lavendulum TaxID=1247861 RepID=A0AB34FII0_9HYPO|nr:F-box domain-containingprotein [Purpureocillium lavendulum]